MNIAEITGFITGIAGVWLTVRQNIWCFPVGLINVGISLFLFIDEKLYSDAVQQAFYIVLLSYGWYMWINGVRKSDFQVTSLDQKSISMYVLITVCIAAFMGSLFHYYTDADVPYLDASATALSFVAQYLIAKKKIENWFIWVIVNLMYIGIYFYKELYLYAALSGVYLILAINGWYSWKKELISETSK